MEEVIAGEAVMTCNGYSLLVMGKSEGPGCFCKINDLLRYGISTLSKQYDFIWSIARPESSRSTGASWTHHEAIHGDGYDCQGSADCLQHPRIAGEYGIQGDYTKG